jgi:hypothetical protein
MLEKVADRFRLGQKDRREAGSPPINQQPKLALAVLDFKSKSIAH